MQWTTSSLQELIVDVRARRGDLNDVEIKSARGGVPALGPTICAFANMPEGGSIILGLDENADFSPVGLTDVAGLEQGVAAQARTSVSPPARCEFQTFAVSSKPVLIATIEGLPLPDRPARHGGRAYLRQSDGDYVMSEQEIAQIELAKTQAIKPTRPDRQTIADSDVADLDPSLLRSFLATARSSSRRYAAASDDEVLHNTGVLARAGSLTLAGLYTLGRSPQAVSPSLSVTAAVQLASKAEGRTRDLVHLVGPVPDLLEDAMSWVVRNTQTTMGYDDRGHGVDATEIPMQAVREIIANALVHRNLDAITDSKRVEIRLLQDRLVITSPGGLWGVSESQLGRPGAKSAVNPVLYDACTFVRMADGSRVIEGEGGGIREAIDALRAAGLRQPRFIDTGVQFSAVIFRHTLIAEDDLTWLGDVADGMDLTSEERAILASMRHGEVWNNSRVRRDVGPMDSTTARRLLQRLVETGLVESSGERGGTMYRIVTRVRQPAPRHVHVAELPPAQPTLPTTQPDERAEAVPEANSVVPTTRHGDTLLRALAGPRSLSQLLEATGLSEGQARYALRRLIGQGRVAMQGAQGDRNTRYSRTGAELRTGGGPPPN